MSKRNRIRPRHTAGSGAGRRGSSRAWWQPAGLDSVGEGGGGLQRGSPSIGDFKPSRPQETGPGGGQDALYSFPPDTNLVFAAGNLRNPSSLSQKTKRNRLSGWLFSRWRRSFLRRMRLSTTAAILLLGVAALAMPISKKGKEACKGHMGLEVPCFELVSTNKEYEVSVH